MIFFRWNDTEKLCVIIIIIIINYYYLFLPPVVKIPGVKTKTKNKLEWLRVGVVFSRERFVKEDRIEPLN